LWCIKYVRDTSHTRCFNGCSQSIIGRLFKILLGQPGIVALGERGLIAGVIGEEEMRPNFMDRLRKRRGYASGKQRGGKRRGSRESGNSVLHVV